MISIKKNAEPRLLTAYRLKPGAVYDGPDFTPVKDAIRRNLLEEQGYVCAYCMQRIHDHPLKTKIEHWHSQHSDLDYKMLLACCDGAQGQPPAMQHCDTSKGHNLLKNNPANLTDRVEEKIRYAHNGIISSDDGLMQADLNTLNLNTPKLVRYRAGVCQAVYDSLSKDRNERTEKEIMEQIFRWQSKNETHQLRPFCGVALYVLRKRLRRAKVKPDLH